MLNGINGGPFAGIAMSGIAGLAHAYPQLADFLDTNLTAAGRSAFATVNSQCNAQNAARFAFTNVYQYFDVSDPLSLPVPSRFSPTTRSASTRRPCRCSSTSP